MLKHTNKSSDLMSCIDKIMAEAAEVSHSSVNFAGSKVIIKAKLKFPTQVVFLQHHVASYP